MTWHLLKSPLHRPIASCCLVEEVFPILQCSAQHLLSIPKDCLRIRSPTGSVSKRLGNLTTLPTSLLKYALE